MFSRRWLRFAGVWVVVLGGVAAERTARAQVVTVSVDSASGLIEKFRVLAKLADPAAARQMLDALDQFDDPGTLKGLDRSKPINVIADLPAGPGQSPFGAAFIPVTSATDFIEGLGRLGVAVDDNPGVPGFTHKVTLPGGAAPPLFVLTTPGYVVASLTPDGVDRLKAVKPAELRPAYASGIYAGVRIDRIPDQLKQLALDGMERNTEAQRERKPGESDEAYKGRLTGMKLAQDAITTLVREGRELALEVDASEKSGKFSTSLSFDGKADSKLANSLAAFGNRQSRFLGVSTEAASSLRGVLPLPEGVRAVLRQSIKAGREQAGKDKSDEERRMINLIIDAVEPTLTGTEIDAILSVEVDDGEDEDDAKDKDKAADKAKDKGDDDDDVGAVLVFGVAAKGSEKIEAALREAVAKGKDEDRKKITFDFAKAKDGTSIHKIDIDSKEPKDPNAEIFGDPTLFVAFPEGAVLATFGEDGLDYLKDALDDLKDPVKPGPQVALEIAANSAIELNQDDDQPAVRAAAEEVFQGKDEENDKLSLSLTGGKSGVRLRLDADLPVLRFLSRVGALQKDKAGK